jgi:hypothetical protein
MMYAVEMGSVVTIFIQSFIKLVAVDGRGYTQ